MKIIIINGCGGVGKDTFVEACQEGDYDVYNLSSVDKVKQFAKILGWDGVKDEKGRKFLSDIKDALTEYNDGPFKYVIDSINDILFPFKQFEMPTDDVIIFIHCREPKEIQRWVDEYKAKTLLIRREVENEYHNHADKNVFDYDYDYVYSNVGDLNQLKSDAIKFIDFIGKQDWSCEGEGLKI